MKNTNKKLTSILLSFIILGSFASFTAYADPDETFNNDDTISDEGNTTTDNSDNNSGGVIYFDPPVIPYSNPTVDEPQDTDNNYTENNYTDNNYTDNNDNDNNVDNSYDNNNYVNDNNYVTYVDDGNIDNNIDNTQTNEEPQINYDADYYNNMYGGNIISYNLNNDFDDNYQSAIVDSYNPGMTFDEFEKATDYQSATVSANNVVDMYNSNGSVSAQTLSESDWKEISLSFDKNSSNGTGDFSFIKNNTSKEDSNFSILFFILGIVFITLSATIITYMIICIVIRNKNSKNFTDNNIISDNNTGDTENLNLVFTQNSQEENNSQ